MPSLRALIFALLSLPVADLVLVVFLRRWVGAPLVTLGLAAGAVLAAAIASLALAGPGTIRASLRERLFEGDPAGAAGLGRSVLLLAALLAFVPGPLTDLGAVLLLVPATRRWLGRWLLGRLLGPLSGVGGPFTGPSGEDRYDAPTPGQHGARPPSSQRRPVPPRGPVRDAEFETLPEDRES